MTCDTSRIDTCMVPTRKTTHLHPCSQSISTVLTPTAIHEIPVLSSPRLRGPASARYVISFCSRNTLNSHSKWPPRRRTSLWEMPGPWHDGTVEIVIVHRIIMHKSHIAWGFAWNQHGTGGNFTYSAYCIMHRTLKWLCIMMNEKSQPKKV